MKNPEEHEGLTRDLKIVPIIQFSEKTQKRGMIVPRANPTCNKNGGQLVNLGHHPRHHEFV
jgi:hypothetical protein